MGGELLGAAEQLGAAPLAGVDALVEGIGVLAGEGAFGALLAQNVVLECAQLLAPLGIRFDQCGLLGVIHVSSLGAFR